MNSKFFLLALTTFFLLTQSSNSLSQNCSKESAEKIENGFPQLKYCMENIGWRESVKKYEWRVTVYNLYNDVKVKISFNLIEAGTARTGLGQYTISSKSSRSYSAYFSSEPEFIYDDIELIEE